jgi:hypothetical protein
MSYKIIDLPVLGRTFNATDIIEVSADGTGSYKANIGDFTLGGENYIFVNANGTPEENGFAVKDAYTLAQTLTPNGNPISDTNRVTILLAPGYYSLNESVDGAFRINTSFIDFISLTGQPDVYFSSIEVYSGTDTVGLNVRLVGIDTTKNNFYPHAAFAITSVGDAANEYIVAKNCVGGSYSFSSFSKGFYGVYDNCVASDFSFCSTGDTTTPTGIEIISSGSFDNYGTIQNCTAGDYSFVSGSYLPAGKINNYGYIRNCKSTGNYSFCYSEYRAENLGAIIDCQSYDYSFCTSNDSVGNGFARNSGAIINCQVYGSGFCVYQGAAVNSNCAENGGLISGCYSSGTAAFVVDAVDSIGSNIGTILNCFINGMGFCGALGVNTGIIIECTAQDNSFCNDTPTNNTGQILRCTLLDDVFTVNPAIVGRVILGIDTTGVVNF